uniref:Uncharacterized protein n=1 Tax=viral metagenome TaxID=1070528 RepID=A0A6C0BLE8_9ZZZZ
MNIIHDSYIAQQYFNFYKVFIILHCKWEIL